MRSVGKSEWELLTVGEPGSEFTCEVRQVLTTRDYRRLQGKDKDMFAQNVRNVSGYVVRGAEVKTGADLYEEGELAIVKLISDHIVAHCRLLEQDSKNLRLLSGSSPSEARSTDGAAQNATQESAPIAQETPTQPTQSCGLTTPPSDGCATASQTQTLHFLSNGPRESDDAQRPSLTLVPGSA